MQMERNRGFSLIELLIVMAIFAVVMAGLYSVYSVQMREGVRQYKLAESEMELQIAKTVLERDVLMAGYGLADEYCTAPTTDTNCPSGLTCGSPFGFCVPVGIRSTNGSSAPDTLTLMGTAIGMVSRSTMGWTYTLNEAPAAEADYKDWKSASYPTAVPTDAREKPRPGDRIIYMEPNVKRLLVAAGTNTGTGGTGKTWMFAYPPAGDDNEYPELTDPGVVVFGLGTDDNASFPYYTVGYHLSSGGSGLSTCAPNTENLLREESRTVANPATGGNPVLNCVLDLQVAFGIDTDEDGDIDCWDNGGTTSAGYPLGTFKTRLKQVKVFILVQEGSRDTSYLYVNPDPPYAAKPDKVWVGDTVLTACGGGSAGREVTLSAEQRNYRWRVASFAMVPRNMR